MDNRLWPLRLWRWIIGDYKRGGVVGLYHWIRCHVWNRYHIINISKQGEYTWGYIDPCEAVTLACFKILVDFVEKEDPTIGQESLEDYVYEGVSDGDLEYFKHQIECYRNIRAIYNWWTMDRPIGLMRMNAFLDIEDYKSYNQAKGTLESMEQVMLGRLIEVRPYLWT